MDDRPLLDTSVSNNTGAHTNNTATGQGQTGSQGRDGQGRDVRQELISLENPYTYSEHNPLAHITNPTGRRRNWLVTIPQQSKKITHSTSIVAESHLCHLLDVDKLSFPLSFQDLKNRIQEALDAVSQYEKQFPGLAGTGSRREEVMRRFDAYLVECIRILIDKLTGLEDPNEKEQGYLQPKSKFELTHLIRNIYVALEKYTHANYEQVFILMIKAISSCKSHDVTARDKEALFFDLLVRYLPDVSSKKKEYPDIKDSLLMLFLNQANVSICQLIEPAIVNAMKSYMECKKNLDTYCDSVYDSAISQCEDGYDKWTNVENFRVKLKTMKFLVLKDTNRVIVSVEQYRYFPEYYFSNLLDSDIADAYECRKDFETTILELAEDLLPEVVAKSDDPAYILAHCYLDLLFIGNVECISAIYEKFLPAINWKESKHNQLDVYYQYAASYKTFEHLKAGKERAQQVLEFYEDMIELFVQNDRPELALKLGAVLRVYKGSCALDSHLDSLLNNLVNTLDVKSLSLKDLLDLAVDCYGCETVDRDCLFALIAEVYFCLHPHDEISEKGTYEATIRDFLIQTPRPRALGDEFLMRLLSDYPRLSTSLLISNETGPQLLEAIIKGLLLGDKNALRLLGTLLEAISPVGKHSLLAVVVRRHNFKIKDDDLFAVLRSYGEKGMGLDEIGLYCKAFGLIKGPLTGDKASIDEQEKVLKCLMPGVKACLAREKEEGLTESLKSEDLFNSIKLLHRLLTEKVVNQYCVGSDGSLNAIETKINFLLDISKRVLGKDLDLIRSVLQSLNKCMDYGDNQRVMKVIALILDYDVGLKSLEGLGFASVIYAKKGVDVLINEIESGTDLSHEGVSTFLRHLLKFAAHEANDAVFAYVMPTFAKSSDLKGLLQAALKECFFDLSYERLSWGCTLRATDFLIEGLMILREAKKYQVAFDDGGFDKYVSTTVLKFLHNSMISKGDFDVVFKNTLPLLRLGENEKCELGQALLRKQIQKSLDSLDIEKAENTLQKVFDLVGYAKEQGIVFGGEFYENMTRILVGFIGKQCDTNKLKSLLDIYFNITDGVDNIDDAYGFLRPVLKETESNTKAKEITQLLFDDYRSVIGDDTPLGVELWKAHCEFNPEGARLQFYLKLLNRRRTESINWSDIESGIPGYDFCRDGTGRPSNAYPDFSPLEMTKELVDLEENIFETLYGEMKPYYLTDYMEGVTYKAFKKKTVNHSDFTVHMKSEKVNKSEFCSIAFMLRSIGLYFKKLFADAGNDNESKRNASGMLQEFLYNVKTCVTGKEEGIRFGYQKLIKKDQLFKQKNAKEERAKEFLNQLLEEIRTGIIDSNYTDYLKVQAGFEEFNDDDENEIPHQKKYLKDFIGHEICVVEPRKSIILDEFQEFVQRALEQKQRQELVSDFHKTYLSLLIDRSTELMTYLMKEDGLDITAYNVSGCIRRQEWDEDDETMTDIDDQIKSVIELDHRNVSVRIVDSPENPGYKTVVIENSKNVLLNKINESILNKDYDSRFRMDHKKISMLGDLLSINSEEEDKSHFWNEQDEDNEDCVPSDVKLTYKGLLRILVNAGILIAPEVDIKAPPPEKHQVSATNDGAGIEGPSLDLIEPEAVEIIEELVVAEQLEVNANNVDEEAVEVDVPVVEQPEAAQPAAAQPQQTATRRGGILDRVSLFENMDPYNPHRPDRPGRV